MNKRLAVVYIVLLILWALVKWPDRTVEPLGNRPVPSSFKTAPGYSVTVLDPNLSPLSGALVSCYRKSGSSQIRVAEVHADEDGMARIPALMNGEYRLSASGWNEAQQDIYIMEHEFEVSASTNPDLGELIGSGPFANLTLHLAGEDGVGRSVRTLVFPDRMNYRKAGSLKGVFECELPLEQTIRLWTGEAGQFQLTMNVTESGSSWMDTSIRARVESITVPGESEFTFEIAP